MNEAKNMERPSRNQTIELEPRKALKARNFSPQNTQNTQKSLADVGRDANGSVPKRTCRMKIIKVASVCSAV